MMHPSAVPASAISRFKMEMSVEFNPNANIGEYRVIFQSVIVSPLMKFDYEVEEGKVMFRLTCGEATICKYESGKPEKGQMIMDICRLIPYLHPGNMVVVKEYFKFMLSDEPVLDWSVDFSDWLRQHPTPEGIPVAVFEMFKAVFVPQSRE